jgi:hypothetical protein
LQLPGSLDAPTNFKAFGYGVMDAAGLCEIAYDVDVLKFPLQSRFQLRVR